MITEEQLRHVALCFMGDDPHEYGDETVEEVMDQLRETSPDFLEQAWEIWSEYTTEQLQ